MGISHELLPSFFPEFAFYPPQNTVSSLPERKQKIEKVNAKQESQ